MGGLQPEDRATYTQLPLARKALPRSLPGGEGLQVLRPGHPVLRPGLLGGLLPLGGARSTLGRAQEPQGGQVTPAGVLTAIFPVPTAQKPGSTLSLCSLISIGIISLSSPFSPPHPGPQVSCHRPPAEWG